MHWDFLVSLEKSYVKFRGQGVTMLVGLFLGLLISSTLGFFPGLQNPYVPARLIGLLLLTGTACLTLIFDRSLRERLREITVLLGVIAGWTLLQIVLDT